MNTPEKKSNSMLLPFILAFCLAGLAAWLFIPWLLEEPAPKSLQKRMTPALAELMRKTQPDHVFFSPHAHSLDSCNQCHSFSEKEYMAMFKLEKKSSNGANPEIFYEARPMSMSECLRCHQIEAHLETTLAGKSCGTCHR